MNKHELKSLLENIYVLLTENAPVPEPTNIAEPVIQGTPPINPSNPPPLHPSGLSPTQQEQYDRAVTNTWMQYWEAYFRWLNGGQVGQRPNDPFPGNRTIMREGTRFITQQQWNSLDRNQRINILRAIHGKTAIEAYYDAYGLWIAEGRQGPAPTLPTIYPMHPPFPNPDFLTPPPPPTTPPIFPPSIFPGGQYPHWPNMPPGSPSDSAPGYPSGWAIT